MYMSLNLFQLSVFKRFFEHFSKSCEWISLQTDGYVTVSYVVGGLNMSISERLRVAADGKYHVVRFTRYGVNSTLQLDSLPTQTRNYSGHFSLQTVSILDDMEDYVMLVLL